MDESNEPDFVVITQECVHPNGLYPSVDSERIKAYVKDVAIGQNNF